MKLILPCAGYGTRVGMEAHESKEMLFDKQDQEKLIDKYIRIASINDFELLVISREDKTQLNNYLESKGILRYYVKNSKEWTDSIYQSRTLWDNENILMFPDAEFFNEEEVIQGMKFHLEECKVDLTLGVFPVDNVTNWCVYEPKSQDIHEKNPKADKDGLAIGVFGFTKRMGESLFHEMVMFNRSYKRQTQLIKVVGFKDLTREKSDRLVRETKV